jgi:hypothetical protein
VPSVHAAEQKLFGNAYANPVYNQTPWAVIQIGRGAAAKVVVFHLVDNAWVVDRSDAVQVGILGPQPGTLQKAITQIAISVKSLATVTQTALFLDGVFLPGKVAGTPHNYTEYSAPTHALTKGWHVVIGFGSSATHGTAVLWRYRAR